MHKINGVSFMIFKFDLKKLLFSLFVPLAVGGLSYLATGGGMSSYKTFEKPPLSPPGIVFPIAWTILYTLMGISLYLVMTKKEIYQSKSTAYVFFALQLFLNFIWSPVFFSAKEYLAAFVILVLMWCAIIGMIVSFFKISKTAGILQIPYLLWVTFAGYLNFGVYLLNR